MTRVGITIVIIWFIIIVWLCVKLLCNYNRKRVATKVLHKGVKGQGSQKQYFKYLCEPIFSQPSNDFNLKEALITLELIHTNQSSEKVKLASIAIDFKTNIELNRDFCCLRDIRGFFEIIRHKVLPPITKIRANIQSSENSQIFLEGIEIHDQMSGERLFFAVNSFIIKSDLKSAIVHSIKPQELVFWTKQTFCPDFLSTKKETFGTKIQTPVESVEEIYGISLLPKLNWFEVFIFNTFLIHLSFALIISLIDNFKDEDTDNKTDIFLIAILATSLLAPTVTQIIAYVYRSVVKTFYNSSCSPMKLETNQWSGFWQFFRLLYLALFLSTSILLSIFDIVFTSEDMEKWIKNEYLITELVLIILLCVSLAITYTVWLSLFALIRFIYRFIFFKPPIVIIDADSEDRGEHSYNQSIATNLSAQSGQTSRSSKKPQKSEKSSALSQRSEKSGKGGYFEEKSKIDDLNTGSVIVGPTQSLGYIDPEMFRLSESRIESTAEQNEDKKKSQI